VLLRKAYWCAYWRTHIGTDKQAQLCTYCGAIISANDSSIECADRRT